MQRFKLMLGALVVAALTLAAKPATAQVVTNDCYICLPCDFNGDGDTSDGHRVTRNRVTRGATGLTISEPNECGPGTCSAPADPDVDHQVCVRSASTAFSVEKLDAAARGGDMLAVAGQIRAGGNIVEVNLKRGALQVIGCQGGVVAHIPMRQDQIQALMAPTAPATLASAE
ncbi:MAG TPA: hypothetical protein VE913_21320, partial [Longimicrobium sp.]|nr:hypothetical protein [Longimicrobium sp.]